MSKDTLHRPGRGIGRAVARASTRTILVVGLAAMTMGDSCEQPCARVVDVTARTGETVCCRLTAWQVPNGSAYVEHLAGHDARGDLLVFWRSGARTNWKVVNVSEKTGKRVSSPVESWVVADVEHLAGRGRNDDLLVFWWSPRADWQVVNVSEKTGYRNQQPVTAWQTPNGPHIVEHLAAADPGNRLIVYWWSPLADWQAVNVTEKTGVRVTSEVASWVTTELDGQVMVEHLAGLGDDGVLYEFTWSPQHDWQAAAVSSDAGLVHGPVADWISDDTEHLAGVADNGELKVFSRQPGGTWTLTKVHRYTDEEVCTELPGHYLVHESNATVEILGARSPQDELLLHWYTPAMEWQSLNLSHAVGEDITTAPVGWITPDGVEHLAAPGGNDRLLVFEDHARPRELTDEIQGPFAGLGRQRQSRDVLAILWDPGRDDATTPPVATVHDTLFGSQDSVRDYFLENSDGYFTVHEAGTLGWYAATYDWENHYIAHTIRVFVHGRAATSDFHLEVRYVANGEKRFRANDTVLQGEWKEYSVSAESQTQVEARLSGTGNADLYVRKGPKPTLTQWECRPYLATSAEECVVDTPAEPCDFIHGHTEKWTDAILKADQDFDFSAYDRDGDGLLAPTELGIVIAIPQNDRAGFVRPTLLREVPTAEPLEVDGVTIGPIAEVYLGNPPNVGTLAHELSHLLLGAGDMYFNFFTATAAGEYSLMDVDSKHPHLDAFHKLKNGWLRPEIIFRTGSYELLDVETRGRAFVLLDPERGSDEFFIVTNRFPANTYDNRVSADGGLAVWHVMEDPAVYGSLPAPPFVDPAKWAELGAGDWGRRAIRMVRPVIDVWDNNRALWDGNQPGVDHDLLSDDPDPTHGTLTWSDGTPSGFNIRDISGPGTTMTMFIGSPLPQP